MPDEKYMYSALNEARKALKFNDVPIGAVIVQNGIIVGRGHNKTEQLSDPTAHAELLAIREAVANSGYKRLINSTIYVTLEPCAMCAGAIVLARIEKVVFGAFDPKAGACKSLYELCSDDRLNHRCEIISGMLELECSILLKEFFAELRKSKKQ